MTDPPTVQITLSADQAEKIMPPPFVAAFPGYYGNVTPEPVTVELGPDRLLDAGELAAILNVPERWVREHTRGGLIPCVRLGRYVRYRRAAVLAWLVEQEDGGAAWRKHRPVQSAGTKVA